MTEQEIKEIVKKQNQLFNTRERISTHKEALQAWPHDSKKLIAWLEYLHGAEWTKAEHYTNRIWLEWCLQEKVYTEWLENHLQRAQTGDETPPKAKTQDNPLKSQAKQERQHRNEAKLYRERFKNSPSVFNAVSRSEAEKILARMHARGLYTHIDVNILYGGESFRY